MKGKGSDLVTALHYPWWRAILTFFPSRYVVRMCPPATYARKGAGTVVRLGQAPKVKRRFLRRVPR
jgi:hypothetical protein